VIIAGAGVIFSEAWDELRELAEKAHIPVVNSLLGLGSFPRDHELSLGMMGMHGEAAATLAVQEADLVLGIGIRFDDRLTGKTGGFAPKPSSSISTSTRPSLAKTIRTKHCVIGDLKASLQTVLPMVQPAKHDSWLKRINGWRESYPLIIPRTAGSWLAT